MARNVYPPLATCEAAGYETFTPTATVSDVDDQVRSLPVPGAQALDVPVIVVGDDGRSRPVIAFDFWEDDDGEGNTTGRAFVLVTGSPNDPHPMWVSGYFKGLAWHTAHDAVEAHDAR